MTGNAVGCRAQDDLPDEALLSQPCDERFVVGQGGSVQDDAPGDLVLEVRLPAQKPCEHGEEHPWLAGDQGQCGLHKQVRVDQGPVEIDADGQDRLNRRPVHVEGVGQNDAPEFPVIPWYRVT